MPARANASGMHYQVAVSLESGKVVAPQTGNSFVMLLDSCLQSVIKTVHTLSEKVIGSL